MNKEMLTQFLDMSKLFNMLAIIGGLVGGFFTYCLGGFDVTMKVLIYLIIADFLAAIIGNIIGSGEGLDSKKMWVGGAKTVLTLLLISVCVQLQKIVAIPLREIVITFYMANTGLSIIENIGMFIPLPKKLKKVLVQLRDSLDEEKEEEENNDGQ